MGVAPGNIYQPMLMTIQQVIAETPDTKTFQLVFQDEADRDQFSFRAGQFAEYSAFGLGESTFCIASSPTRMQHIECCFRRTGRVTSALFRLQEGDTVGLRGPYGNSFPIEDCFGKNLLFVAGGIALPPLRTLIWNCLDWRDRFGEITIVYGARTVEDMVYKRELDEWSERADVNLVKTVDPGGETADWDGQVGRLDGREEGGFTRHNRPHDPHPRLVEQANPGIEIGRAQTLRDHLKKSSWSSSRKLARGEGVSASIPGTPPKRSATSSRMPSES